MLNVLGILIFGFIPLSIAGWLLACVLLEYRRDRIPILLYHRLISQADAERGLVRDTEMIYVAYDRRFREQMDWLKANGYTTIDLDEYCAIRNGSLPMPNKAVLITFDDGYSSNYRYAFPELKRNGQKAIIFVAPEPDEHTRSLVEGIDGFLNREQIREMVAHGISIQSHTLTHCVLAELPEELVRYELEESRRRIEEMSGRPVEHIAIPRAGYSRRVLKLVRRAGYKTACCNGKGSSHGLSAPLALPRIVIERDMTLSDFARCLTPKGSLSLRIIGGIKRIPERLGGARMATRLRYGLYKSFLGSLFKTHNLKRALAAASVAYAAGTFAFWYSILRP